MAANKQASKHTHARAQCSPTSVGLTQVTPIKKNSVNYILPLSSSLLMLYGRITCVAILACSDRLRKLLFELTA